MELISFQKPQLQPTSRLPIVPSFVFARTSQQRNRTKLPEQIFSLKRDLPYKIVTKVADFQIEKARASTRSTTSPVVLYFLLTSLLQNPYADTNNFYIFKAKKCKT